MARSRARVRVFSDDGHCVHDARLMRRALEYVSAFGGVVSQHAQDPRLAGPAPAATRASSRAGWACPAGPASPRSPSSPATSCSRGTPARGSTSPTSPLPARVEVIRWAKAQGIDVTAEVTPHHLVLTTDLLAGYDPVYKVNPPLRPREDVEALRAALADGTIDAVATDHAPHARHDKEHAFVDAAFGMLGLETALSVVSEAMVGAGLLDWAGVAPSCPSPRPASAGLAATAAARRRVRRPTSRSSTPTDVTVDRALASQPRNNPWHGRTLPAR